MPIFLCPCRAMFSGICGSVPVWCGHLGLFSLMTDESLPRTDLSAAWDSTDCSGIDPYVSRLQIICLFWLSCRVSATSSLHGKTQKISGCLFSSSRGQMLLLDSIFSDSSASVLDPDIHILLSSHDRQQSSGMFCLISPPSRRDITVEDRHGVMDHGMLWFRPDAVFPQIHVFIRDTVSVHAGWQICDQGKRTPGKPDIAIKTGMVFSVSMYRCSGIKTPLHPGRQFLSIPHKFQSIADSM